MFAVKSPQKPGPAPASQAPLGPSELRLIVVQATIIAVASYLFSFAALLFVFVLILCDFIIMLALSRVLLGGLMRPAIIALGELAKQILISLNLRRPQEYFVDITQDDAPDLWNAASRLAERIGVEKPSRIVVEMSRGAYIELFGKRTGQGRATLSLGFDLFAILSDLELESVIAHELAHAKLTQRGYMGWLKRSLIRTYQLGRALAEMNTLAKRRKTSFYTALSLQKIVNALGPRAARLVSAYERQDEFLADAKAVEICGSAAFANALAKTCCPGRKGVNWRDRLLQIQRGGSLLALLREELALSDEQVQSYIAGAMQNPTDGDEDSDDDAFSTHPPFAARLAAIGAYQWTPATPSRPASLFLTDPESLAARLIRHLEELARKQQRRQSILLKKRVRKGRLRRTKYTVGEYLGSAFIVFGGLLLIPAIGGSFDPYRAAAIHNALIYGGGSVGSIALGLVMLKAFALGDKILLPVPGLATWEAAMRERNIDTSDRVDLVTSQLKASLPAQCKSRAQKARFWVSDAYQALGACDFLRASIAADLCLQAQRKNFRGLTAKAVAAAYFNNPQIYNQCLGMAYAERGIGPSISWAAGWSLAMLGDWQNSEAYLLDAADRREEDAVVWSFLAISQARQGKYQEALSSADQAILLAPSDPAVRLLKVRILLAKSDAREAEKELQGLEHLSGANADIAMALIHTDLSLGNREKADQRAGSLVAKPCEHRILRRLGEIYWQAKDLRVARSYFCRAEDAGFDSQVCLDLGQIALNEREMETARACFLKALDTSQTPAPGGSPGSAAFDQALSGLLQTAPKSAGCVPWSAMAQVRLTTPTADTKLIRLDIRAASRDSAENYARELCQALCPNGAISEVWVEQKSGGEGATPAPEIPEGVITFKFQQAASEALLSKPARRAGK